MVTNQELIDKFLTDFTSNIVSKYKEEIDFILLFGSAARGEFVKGASDVDLVIQAKSGKDVDEIQTAAEKLFWILDKKYDLEFKKSLSIAKTKRPIEKFLLAIEARAHLFKPIFVFGPDELDWKHGTVRTKRLDWILGATFLASLATTFLKMKKEGEILFGRDVRKEIRPKLNFWERWKGIWLPFYLAAISIFVFPLSRKEGLKLATKAVLWQIDAVLIFLGKLFSGQKEKLFEVLEKELRVPIIFTDFTLKLLPKSSISIINEAAEIRRNNFQTPFLAGLLFCYKALFFVIIISWLANFKLIFRLLFD